MKQLIVYNQIEFHQGISELDHTQREHKWLLIFCKTKILYFIQTSTQTKNHTKSILNSLFLVQSLQFPP